MGWIEVQRSSYDRTFADWTFADRTFADRTFADRTFSCWRFITEDMEWIVTMIDAPTFAGWTFLCQGFTLLCNDKQVTW